MLKKIPPLLLAALTALTLALAPAQSAAAWERVCMHLPLWHTWFAARFHVVSDFSTGYHVSVPGSIWDWERKKQLRILPHQDLGASLNNRATGFQRSAVIGANASRCLDISAMRPGTPFIVYTHVEGGKAVLCKTHPDNPKPWYFQAKTRYREIWYKSWGASQSPRCEFTHER